jgi:hypothetical protein
MEKVAKANELRQTRTTLHTKGTRNYNADLLKAEYQAFSTSVRDNAFQLQRRPV